MSKLSLIGFLNSAFRTLVSIFYLLNKYNNLLGEKKYMVNIWFDWMEGEGGEVEYTHIMHKS